MKKRTRHTLLVVTLLLGLGSCGTSAFIFDDLVHSYRNCADGWDSPSIGRQGACSHHGGVVTRTVDNRTVPQKVLTYSLIAFGSLSLLIAFALRASEDFPPAIPIEFERASYAPLNCIRWVNGHRGRNGNLAGIRLRITTRPLASCLSLTETRSENYCEESNVSCSEYMHSHRISNSPSKRDI